MPQTSNFNRLSLVRTWMTRALELPKGLAIDIPSKGEAVALRNQFYTARKRAEEVDKVNAYDALVCIIREQSDGTCVLYIQRGETAATSIYNVKEVQ